MAVPALVWAVVEGHRVRMPHQRRASSRARFGMHTGGGPSAVVGRSARFDESAIGDRWDSGEPCRLPPEARQLLGEVGAASRGRRRCLTAHRKGDYHRRTARGRSQAPVTCRRSERKEWPGRWLEPGRPPVTRSGPVATSSSAPARTQPLRTADGAAGSVVGDNAAPSPSAIRTPGDADSSPVSAAARLARQHRSAGSFHRQAADRGSAHHRIPARWSR